MQPLDFARGKSIAMCATAAVCLGLIVSTFAQSASDGWSSKAPLGVLRTEVGSAFVGGKLYVVAGGLAMSESSPLVQEYDPKTDRWRERAALPMPLSHVGVAALNGKVYAVGGFLKSVHLYAQPYAFEFDPGRNTWRALP
jgi:N-acetylneuraminic acid mutarotase